MASGTFYPSSGADDGYGTSWEFVNNADVIIMGPTGSYNNTRKDSFVRFTNVNVPAGATITNAYVRFQSYGNYSANVCQTDVYFLYEANPPAPTSFSDFKNPPWGSATVTSESILWVHGSWVQDTYYNSPDISSVVQEVVNHPSWNDGNSMVGCLLEETGSNWTANRRAYSYEGNGVGPVLYVEWRSVVMSAAISSPPNVRELINRIAYEASSIEYWDAGQHNLVYLPTHTTVAKTIDANRIDSETVDVRYTDRVDLLNALTLWYDYYWSGYSGDDAFRQTVTDSDATSIATYGNLESDPSQFQMLRGTANAERALAWILAQYKNPRVIVSFTGGYYLTDIRRGNLLQFDFVEGDTLDDAFSGLVTTTDKYMVTNIVRSVGSIGLEVVQLIAV